MSADCLRAQARRRLLAACDEALPRGERDTAERVMSYLVALLPPCAYQPHEHVRGFVCLRCAADGKEPT